MVTKTLSLSGKPINGHPWYSGTWTGDFMSAGRIAAFAAWRQAPVDATITYPERTTFADIAASEWHIATFDGVPGKLIYGLPLLPENGTGTFQQVAAGRQDWVWTKVARDLVKHGRGDSVVRVGWEANGDSWFTWGATAATAGGFRAAYRHVVGVMKKAAPNLRFDFDITCGRGLTGSSDRLASLTRLYPGDDVVDIVGCDNYDMWQLRATDEQSWARSLRPDGGPGLADVAAFARSHGKGFAIPEWGVVSKQGMGNGDNPFYISKMHQFMMNNQDIMTFEAYFNDHINSIQSSLWIGSRNPRSAATYRSLWRR